MLDKQGIALMLVMAVAIILASDYRYLAMIIIFLAFSVAATKYEHGAKRDLGLYEHERSWENVLSNGLVPTLLAAAGGSIGFMPYLCSVAAVTADKFGSELGVLGRSAISLENFKPVKAGRSGAISALGCVASLAGATIIGVSAIAIFNIDPTRALLVGIIGFAGSLVDSVLGVFEEHGIGNKATTNLGCSVASAIIGYYLL
jgi:uncharacterized protein (TIGR00297 family)